MHSPILLAALGLVLPAFSKPVSCPSPDSSNIKSFIRDEIARLRQDDAPPQPACDLSEVKLPQAPSPLPDIPEGQKLLGVTVGRGTQVSIVNCTRTQSAESTS